MLFYTAARLVLFVVLTAAIFGIGHVVLHDGLPLILSALFGLLISLPVSMFLFKKIRQKVNADIAVVDERRRRDKEDLRARIRGEDGSR
ncbi:DUF4229 domain-containing protein [Rhodococcus sp. D2-41]|nr:DUF4229 domain-containing protein [Rhodococcus sp. D2-41]